MNGLIKLLLLLFSFATFLNAEPTIRLSKQKIKKGEPLYLELEFKGKPSLEVSQKIITQNNVTLEYLGSQDNLSIINGKVSQKRTLKFRVVTSKDGKLQTPTFAILEDGTPVNIPAQTFEVSKEKYVFNSNNNLDDIENLVDRIIGLRKRRDNSYLNPDEIHIFFRTNKQKVYVGETLVGYYLFYLRDSNDWFLERNQQTNPEFPFFTSELLNNVSIDAPSTEEYNGVIYNLFPYEREVYALIPLRKGNFKIGKTSFLLVDGGLESLFSQKNIEAQPAEITVLDLPEPKPQNFSGEVGNYKITVSTTQTQISLGEPWQVKLEISGYGMGLLFRDPLTEHCQIFQCKARVSFLGENRDRKFVKTSEGNYNFKTMIQFNYSIFSTQEGDLDLGEISINYFNPEKEAYEESKTHFPILKVLPKSFSAHQESEIENDRSLYLPLLLLLLSGSLSFLIYNFREEILSLIREFKFSHLYIKVITFNKELQELDKLIGNKTGFLLKNYLLSKNLKPELIDKIIKLKSQYPDKKMVDIYHLLKKEDKEELSKLIQEQFGKGEKL